MTCQSSCLIVDVNEMIMIHRFFEQERAGNITTLTFDQLVNGSGANNLAVLLYSREDYAQARFTRW